MSEHSDFLQNLRKAYQSTALKDDDFGPHPIPLCRKWIEEAVAHQLSEPTAMVLSTVSAKGQVSSRAVLLKELNESGFTFFTNYESAKAQDIADHAQVGLLFLWIDMERQLRVEGHAERVTPQVSEQYFAARPRGSQISAWASHQSDPLADRSALEAQFRAEEQRFAHHQQIPCPPNWGGYLVQPYLIEFWQGDVNRLHARIQYRKQSKTKWEKQWLGSLVF